MKKTSGVYWEPDLVFHWMPRIVFNNPDCHTGIIIQWLYLYIFI
jgi:hypothetical protein